MRKRSLMFLCFAIIIVCPLISKTDARGDIFVVEPEKEIAEIVQLGLSDEVRGTVSVRDGFIDFYVTNPSGIVLFCYNKTTFASFNFTSYENGTYEMHFANLWSTNNVTVTLKYGINFTIVLQEKIHTSFSIPSSGMIVYTTSPFNWIEFIRQIWAWILAIPSALYALPKAILKFLRWLHWRRKYKKSRTPAVISTIVDKIISRVRC